MGIKQMGINLAILELKQNLVGAINTAKLPPAVIGLVLSELGAEMEKLRARAVEAEREAEEEVGDNGEEIRED